MYNLWYHVDVWMNVIPLQEKNIMYSDFILKFTTSFPGFLPLMWPWYSVIIICCSACYSNKSKLMVRNSPAVLSGNAISRRSFLWSHCVFTSCRDRCWHFGDIRNQPCRTDPIQDERKSECRGRLGKISEQRQRVGLSYSKRQVRINELLVTGWLLQTWGQQTDGAALKWTIFISDKCVF